MLHSNLQGSPSLNCSFKIYGIWPQTRKQASIHTHMRNALTLLWGLLRVAPIRLYLSWMVPGGPSPAPTARTALENTHRVDMHMVAARLGFERAMVVIGWATSHPDCMDSLRISHLVEGWFLARKAAWALSGCMAIDSADYCMLTHGTLLFFPSNCNNTQL